MVRRLLESHFSTTFNYSLTGLEEQNGHLTQVEIDEMFGLVRHVTSEISSDDAMPSWIEFFVELFFNIGGDVLLYVEFFQCLRRAVHSLLLHLLRHVGVFDHGFTI